MRVLYRKIASVYSSVKSYNKYKDSLPCPQVKYCIEDIQKGEGENEVVLLIRNLITKTLCYKKPISLYCDKSFLNLFSYQDIEIIMRHVICQVNNSILEAVKFEGYDYIDNDEVSSFYDVRFKKKRLKELINSEDGSFFDFLSEKERLYFDDFRKK